VPHRPPRCPLDNITGLLLGWGSDRDRAPFGFASPADAGDHDPRQPLVYRGDGHLATVAPTGAGKGRGVIIPNLLSYRGPVIVIDPKGENYQVTARRRRELGQQVVVLDPFRVVTDRSDRLNPLDIFDLDRSILDCDAEMLASLLAVGHHFSTDPFWNDSANGIVSGLIAHVASTSPPPERTLNKVRSFVYADDLDYTLAVMLDTKAVTSQFARDEIVAYLSHPSDKTRPSVRSTVSTYIKALGSEAVAASLEPSSFALRDVVEGKPLSIYLVIPPEKLESHRALLRLWVGTLLTAVARRRHIPRQRTLFLLDECAQLGTMPALRQAVTLLRGYGLQVWSFWQDLSQLRLLYPQEWQTMLNNCGVVQTFGVASHLMAREWGEVLGQDPHEMRTVPAEDALVLINDQGLSRCRRPDYLRDKAFAGMFDPNERFALLAVSRNDEQRETVNKAVTTAPGGPSRGVSWSP
jgi:type IV secretion system protein VirD4